MAQQSTWVKKQLVILHAFILFIPVSSWGQVENLAANIVVQYNSILTPDTSQVSYYSGQIPCNSNTFWINSFDSIIEFSLFNSVVTTTGIYYQLNNGLSLSFANNNSPNASLNPTFFTTKSASGIASLWVFNGSGWDTVATFPDLNFINSAGHGNSIYIDGYTLLSGYLNKLFRYTNGILDTIYTCPSGSKISVADVAVDFLGKIYLFTGPISGPFVDTLLVLSSSGNILNVYPISFNSLHAYGSFILGDTIYIGFGPSNPLYSSAIVPVAINQAIASLGSPIPVAVPTGSFFDMESCNPGIPVGLTEEIQVSHIMQLYPNPAFTSVTFQIPNTSVNPEVYLMTIHGKQIQANFINVNNDYIELKLEDLPSGLYVVKLVLGNKSYHGKFEHINN